ncbi:uncharacterized protein LOC127130675 [Lathyrus oleraceus]|uniref:uncharacterized protein LOC127130675 n=1 Tax=Pisum sativum TaxID=3888 RepID=UPI0021D0BB55|nr:uncharacterized protein LOC127130675 [Pisum sativum]
MNNNNGGIPNSLLVLDGKNWIRWNKPIQSLFGFHETFEVVTNGIHMLAINAIDAQRVNHRDAKKKDCKALFCIQLAVDSPDIGQISHVESSKEAWDVLVKYYEGDSNNLETLKLEYLNGSLEAHELRIIERKGVQDSTHAPQAQTWKKHDVSNKFRGKTKSKKSWLNPQKHKVDSESSKRGEGTSTNKEEKKGV